MLTGTVALAFLAGTLSILSPCVLPLVPIVLGSARSEHPLAPLALAAGLALSFTAIGLFVATIGFSIGLDGDWFRSAGGIALLALGLVLLVPALQMRLATAGGPASNWIESRSERLSTRGAGGQFLLGLVLGAVWAPCVGPTLGAASLLAAKGEQLADVALTMSAFGIGAGVPLLLLGLLSRGAMQRWRGRLIEVGGWGKTALGLLLVLVGAMVLTGLDKTVETALVELSPDWLTELTTRY